MKNDRLTFRTLLMGICIIFFNTSMEAQTRDKTPLTTSFDIQKAKPIIDGFYSQLSKQLRDGDSVGLASHYWPDAEILLSGKEAIKGKEILAYWSGMVRLVNQIRIKEVSDSTTDIKGDSEFLIETGTYQIRSNNDNLIDKGKYMTVWQQRNGEWKLYRDIGNSNIQPKN